uniref:Uncharacterized protein n=1 Tax=Moorena producens (strain JHB) TaxID=1454205 RepID=A0A1D9G2X6_MOOP1
MGVFGGVGLGDGTVKTRADTTDSTKGRWVQILLVVISPRYYPVISPQIHPKFKFTMLFIGEANPERSY